MPYNSVRFGSVDCGMTTTMAPHRVSVLSADDTRDRHVVAIFSVLCESAFEALRKLPVSPVPPNQSVIAVAPMPFPDRRHSKVVRRSECFVRSETRERRSMLLLVETNTFQRGFLPMGRTN